MADKSKVIINCKGCDKECSSYKTRAKHHFVCKLAMKIEKAYYIKIDDEKFECNTCEAMFTKQSNISRHVKKQHKKVKVEKVKKLHTCTTCRKSFTIKWKLKRHLTAHEFEGYQCHCCIKKYSRIDMYSNHLEKCCDDS